MGKPTLVLILGTIAFAVINSSVSQESVDEPGNFERPTEGDQWDSLNRDVSAYAKPSAEAKTAGYRPPGPVPPPSPLPGLGLECFACTGCPSVKNATVKLCPPSFDPTQRKCVVYSEKYNHMKKPWFIRGCVSERGTCADIRASHDQQRDLVRLLSCRECEGDKCNNSNGAPHSLPDLIMGFIVMIATPLLAKYTLS